VNLIIKGRIQISFFIYVIILVRENLNGKNEQKKKKCALCECSLPENNELNICGECVKSADCCIGLEKISE
jgi:hypothetical protein